MFDFCFVFFLRISTAQVQFNLLLWGIWIRNRKFFKLFVVAWIIPHLVISSSAFEPQILSLKLLSHQILFAISEMLPNLLLVLNGQDLLVFRKYYREQLFLILILYVRHTFELCIVSFINLFYVHWFSLFYILLSMFVHMRSVSRRESVKIKTNCYVEVLFRFFVDFKMILYQPILLS